MAKSLRPPHFEGTSEITPGPPSVDGIGATPAIENEPLTAQDLRDAWAVISVQERLEGFAQLDRSSADDFFLSLPARDQSALLLALPNTDRRSWVRLLPPDDAVDAIQALDEEHRGAMLQLLDGPTRQEVQALLAYAQDAAGGLMSPRFARLRPDVSVEEAVRYLRRQAREHLEMIYYAYILDQEQRLRGVVSFRDLFTAPGEKLVSDIMNMDVVSVPDTLDQEAVAKVMARYDLNAVPVVDEEGRMKGIVTIDDIVDVVQREATEDIQKLGGMEALETPYMQASLLDMIKKRAGWLSALFLGEMLTASAMGHYQEEIAQAVVLTLFVPLIISSGGNSGSQATTLIIRAMALGEVTLNDWWRIVRRELLAGLSLGCILAVIGVIRISIWQLAFHTYGDNAVAIAFTVAMALVGVVSWGTTVGSMLPIVIRRFGFDPASASAPFVATLVDVFGLVIYFSVARIFLAGTLL
jgi:magnesium transporter